MTERMPSDGLKIAWLRQNVNSMNQRKQKQKMATDRYDSDGWKRGAKGVDGNNKGQYEKGNDFKMPKSDCSFGVEDDYGATAVSHRLANLVEDGAESGELGAKLQSKLWQPGPVKQGDSPPRYAPKGYHDTQPVKAISHESKGQRGNFGKKSADKWTDK